MPARPAIFLRSSALRESDLRKPCMVETELRCLSLCRVFGSEVLLFLYLVFFFWLGAMPSVWSVESSLSFVEACFCFCRRFYTLQAVISGPVNEDLPRDSANNTLSRHPQLRVALFNQATSKWSRHSTALVQERKRTELLAVSTCLQSLSKRDLDLKSPVSQVNKLVCSAFPKAAETRESPLLLAKELAPSCTFSAIDTGC